MVVNKYEPVIDGANSEWNEAMFKMMRLHKLQTEINIVKMNPFGRYELTGDYNYIALFRLLNGLYDEGKAKYKSTEIVEVDLIRDTIEKLYAKCPPHTTKVGRGYGKDKIHQMLNQENWALIYGLLQLFESKVKLYNDRHGLSTKNSESLDGRSIIR